MFTCKIQKAQIGRLLHSHICAHLGTVMDFANFLDEEGLPVMDTPLGGNGYPLDSISLMSLAAHITRAFHLNELGLEDHLLRSPTLGKWCDLLAKGWAEGITAMTFMTSGSTQQARPMCHDLALLHQEVTELADLFADTRRIVALVPAHHIYGFLFTVLLPQAMGIPVLEGRHLGPGTLHKLLADGDLLVSHPFQWGFLGQSWKPLAVQVRGVSSTAPCPPEVRHRLSELGLHLFTEVYGSSETGGLGHRGQGDAAYQLFSYWRPAGPGEDPPLERTLPDGRTLAVPAPDRLHWEDARSFHVVGRRDGAVQVAGHNVYPTAIARIIEEHPDVAACEVRLMRQDEGDRLKAFVVPNTGADWQAVPTHLHSWCQSELSAASRPAHFTLGHVLPTNAMGKPADWSL